MSFRFFFAVTGAALVAWVAVACGDDDEGAGPPAPDASADAVIDVTPNDGGADAIGQGGPGLDPSFGTNGYFTQPGLLDDSETASGAARQADGKLVMIVWNQGMYQIELVRFNVDGSLDNTFGTAGKLLVWSGVSTLPREVVIQSDGKIVAVGSLTYATTDERALLVRVDAFGNFDPTFGTRGRVEVPNTYASRIALQPDGKILVAGDRKVYPGDGGPQDYGFSFSGARLQTNGALDTGFGTSGYVTVMYGGDPREDNYCSGVGVDPSGNVYLGGSWRPEGGSFSPFVARFTPSGQLDTGYGTGGKALIPNSPDGGVGIELYAFSSMLVQPDGKVVIGGSKNNDMFVARFDATGAPDGAFGTSGVFTTALPGSSRHYAIGLVPGPAGSVVAAVSRDVDDGYLVRVTSIGTLDNAFAGGSVLVPAQFSFGGIASGASDSVFAVGGAQSSGQGANSVAVHVAATGSIDSAYADGGVASANARATREHYSRAVVLPSGEILADGTLAFTPQGVRDPASPIPAVTGAVSALGTDPIGRPIFAAGMSYSMTFDVGRATATGALDTSFGTGLVTFSPGVIVEPHGVGADTKGRILAAGRLGDPNGDQSAFVAATTNAGAVDMSFGTAGVARLDITDKKVSANGMVVQGDDKIVIVGTVADKNQKHDDMIIARFEANGQLDGTFGPTTIDVTDRAFDYGTGIALAPDGKIVVCGIAGDEFNFGDDIPDPYHRGGIQRAFVMRFMPNGQPDGTFGDGGKVILSQLGDDAQANAILVEPDGKIIVAGSRYGSARSDGFLVRLGPTGAIATPFAGANDGIFFLGAGNATSFLGATRQADGRIVASGFIHVSPTGEDVLLARINP